MARLFFRFRKLWLQPRRAWKWITISDDRGVATIFVALFLVGFLALAAWLVDITGMLIRTEELHTMADLGAAAGGRLVAEEVAALATQNVSAGMFSAPSIEGKDHPEKFITSDQRNFVQTDPQFIAIVENEVRKFIFANAPMQLTLDSNAGVAIKYPEDLTDCSDPAHSFIILHVTLNYSYPYILAGVANLLKAPTTVTLSANGYYQIKICP